MAESEGFWDKPMQRSEIFQNFAYPDFVKTELKKIENDENERNRYTNYKNPEFLIFLLLHSSCQAFALDQLTKRVSMLEQRPAKLSKPLILSDTEKTMLHMLVRAEPLVKIAEVSSCTAEAVAYARQKFFAMNML